MSKKITTDFIKMFFRLSIPVIISEVVLLIANNVSMAILGTLSDKAISGFSVANEAFNIYSMVVLGLIGGFQVYISQYYGNKNKEKYNQVLRFGLKSAFVVGVIFNLGLFIFAEPFAHLFLSDPETLGYAIPYLRVFTLTFIPYAMNLLVSGSYSMIGKAKIALYGGILNCVVNLLFCYLLVYGIFFPPLGAQGAAFALVIARLSEMIFLYIVLNRPHSDFRFKLYFPKLNSTELIRIYKTSIPLILNEVLFSIAYMIIFLNYSYIGEQYLACIPIVTAVTKLVFVPATGAGAVIGVMVGGKLGSDCLEEAKENAMKILKTCITIVGMGCVLIAVASPLIPRFFSLKGDVYTMAVKMLLIKAVCSMLGGGVTMVFYNILRVGGDSVSVFKLDGLFSCFGPLLFSFIFSRLIPVPFLMLYFIVEFMTVIKSLLGLYFLKKEKWVYKLS